MAADAIKGGKIKFNGETPKAAREAKVGDEYQIQLGELQKSIRVIDFPKNRVAAKDVPAFLEDLTPAEEYQSIKRLKEYRFVFRPRGTGRPTKKERRDIEDWMGEDSGT